MICWRRNRPGLKRDIGVEYCDRYSINGNNQSIYTGGSLNNILNQSLYFHEDCILAACWQPDDPHPIYCPLSLVRVNSNDGGDTTICVPGDPDYHADSWPSQCTDYADKVSSLSCSRIWCTTSSVSIATTTTVSALEFTSTFSGTLTKYHVETLTSTVQNIVTSTAVTLLYPTNTIIRRDDLLIKRQNGTMTSTTTSQGLQFTLPDTLSLVYITDPTVVSVTILESVLTTQTSYFIQPYNTTRNSTFSIPTPTIPTISNNFPGEFRG